jgi:hypothetical protein
MARATKGDLARRANVAAAFGGLGFGGAPK